MNLLLPEGEPTILQMVMEPHSCPAAKDFLLQISLGGSHVSLGECKFTKRLRA